MEETSKGLRVACSLTLCIGRKPNYLELFFAVHEEGLSVRYEDLKIT
ncbi:MAG: hypothetical protein ISS63_15405 [Desulfobacteraceae bacterium]|nr:hypothetical protein [Desulfobacteraceae bacterium]